MPKTIKVALIDSHALIHRAYHALPPMSTSAGVPTNAVYGFTAILLKVLTAIKPTHVVAAFDMKGPTFRHEEFADYKAHRAPAEDDLVVQFDLVRELVRAFNIPILEKKGFEADDIIGTIVRGVPGSISKIIVTGDMDTLQLVNDSTTVFTLGRGVTDTISYNEAAVQERYGFPPKHVVDYKGLRGDPSDNIPGVAGIGDKTAKELVSKYGSIETIYEHLDELSPRAQTRLRGHKKDALFSRRLATIRCDVPLQFDLTAAQLDDYDLADVRALFAKFEFRSFLQRLPKSSRNAGTVQLSLAGIGKQQKQTEKVERIMPDHYHVVESAKEKAALKKLMLKQKVFAFDT
ncbi:MAG: 5'-3' exonuclease H3TH domain-containing protein, partial [Candidatus Andersenbacteria bacterium]